MKHGSLFSGIGGFDLAAEWMGWDNVFHCEWMPFPRKVLNHYWPEAVSYHDITTTDFRQHAGQIDILTGGFPCQPYSAAGKRKGKDDDRHLWPHMLRCIREVKPRWVVGENVFGLATWNGGLVFEEVCTDLEAEGYAVQPFVLPAAAVNAPHRRDRVWFVAYRDLHGRNECNGNYEVNAGQGRQHAQRDAEQSDEHGDVTNSSSRNSWQRSVPTQGCGKCATEKSKATNTGITRRHGICVGIEKAGCNVCGIFQELPDTEFIADASSEGLEGLHRPEQAERFGSRLYQTPDWHNFPTQPPVCGGDDGIPAELDGITIPKWRAESIKGYGNAIVPQVALQIFKAIQQYEETIYES